MTSTDAESIEDRVDWSLRSGQHPLVNVQKVCLDHWAQNEVKNKLICLPNANWLELRGWSSPKTPQ